MVGRFMEVTANRTEMWASFRDSTSYMNPILEVIGINLGCRRAEEDCSIFSPFLECFLRKHH